MWEAAVLIGFVGISGVLIYISTRLDEDHFFLKLIFLFITLITFIVGLGIANEMVAVESITSSINIIYRVVLYLTIIVFMYYIFYFIYSTFKNKKQALKEEYGEA